MTDAPAPRLPISSASSTIMARLRDPVAGCPWDVAQSFATIAPYTIEEAYEVAEAAEAGDAAALMRRARRSAAPGRLPRAHGRGSKAASPSPTSPRAIADKMVRRHPHVFGDRPDRHAAAQTVAWEAQKAAERAGQGRRLPARPPSALDGVGPGLPALTRAAKLQRRAARVGFDWPDVAPIFAKIDEEIGEVRHEIEAAAPPARIADEVGDLLFAVVNLARRPRTRPRTGPARRLPQVRAPLPPHRGERWRRAAPTPPPPASTRWRPNGSAPSARSSGAMRGAVQGLASRWIRLEVSQRPPPRAWTRSIELIDQGRRPAAPPWCAAPRRGRSRDPCASNRPRSRNRTCRRAWCGRGSRAARTAPRPWR